MNILYVGDVMGELGIKSAEQVLADLRSQEHIDLVIAQAENVTAGRGICLEDFRHLRKAGVDFCTGGNWSLHIASIIPALNDPTQPIIRPANYPTATPGLGWKYALTPRGRVLVISLLGKIVGRDSELAVDNPLRVVDRILEEQKDEAKLATIVNFHGDYSSEKIVIGHYLDGRVTAVVGDHWHVPTADARVLPRGTAHISDVGMCGALDSSLGVKFDVVVPRWLNGVVNRNQLETTGRTQFNAVLITSNNHSGLAQSIRHIQIYSST